MIVDLSFMNSVTGSGLVAKSSNILQDMLFIIDENLKKRAVP
jgi:hypothetical protein